MGATESDTPREVGLTIRTCNMMNKIYGIVKAWDHTSRVGVTVMGGGHLNMSVLVALQGPYGVAQGWWRMFTNQISC